MSTPTASLYRAFEAGLLFMVGDEGQMLLQVCQDFDVTRKELDKNYGRSLPLMQGFVSDNAVERCREWPMRDEKMYNKAFEQFFRAFKPPAEVTNKPTIHKLVLMPYVLGTPIVPNDLGDRR